jgi:hypothetical protein
MLVEASHLFFELEKEVLEVNNMKTEQQGVPRICLHECPTHVL